MFGKYLLPLIAVGGLTFAVWHVVKLQAVPDASKPLIDPPRAPQFRSISGAGLVEAKRENIPIGATVPGVVDKVFVVIGQFVKAGEPLFHIDDRDLRAELVGREASVTASRSQLARLKAAPRPEDVPPAEATVEQAKAMLLDARAAFKRSDGLHARGMLAASDYDKDKYAEKSAIAALAKAEADLQRIKAGSWIEDIRVAEAQLLQAQAQVDSLRINIDRLTVKALADGEVLQVHVRPGQFAALQWNEPLIVLGDVKTLHVRVDIDENDVPFFRPSNKAIATLKGRSDVRFPLEFVKVEPYVIPKKSLTGDNSERVDTRVLQAIFSLRDAPIKVYVGQQMDVYVKADIPKDFNPHTGPEARLPLDDELDGKQGKDAKPESGPGSTPAPAPVKTAA